MLLEHNPCFLISEMGYQCCIALSCVNTANLPQGPYQHEDTISQSRPVSGLSLNRNSGLLHTFHRQAWKTKSSLKNYNKHIKMKNFSHCFFTLLCCLETKQFYVLFLVSSTFLQISGRTLFLQQQDLIAIRVC